MPIAVVLLSLAGACAAPPTPPAPAEAGGVAPAITTVRSAFPPPAGATRVDGGAFGAWLGDRRVLPPDRPVRTHDGRVVSHHARVVDLDLVDGDLQQCADSAIRLRAEWQAEVGEEVMFHATSGDPIPWSRWRGGERPYAVGQGLTWRPGTSGGWESYLRAVFTWAGTWSVERYDTVAATEPRPGDLLIQGGFPGHAVILLDVAVRDGRTWLVVGEGFMPAQEFHVELGPDGGWWPWDGGLDLGHWSFGPGALRRWR